MERERKNFLYFGNAKEKRVRKVQRNREQREKERERERDRGSERGRWREGGKKKDWKRQRQAFLCVRNAYVLCRKIVENRDYATAAAAVWKCGSMSVHSALITNSKHTHTHTQAHTHTHTHSLTPHIHTHTHTRTHIHTYIPADTQTHIHPHMPIDKHSQTFLHASYKYLHGKIRIKNIIERQERERERFKERGREGTASGDKSRFEEKKL